MAKKYIPFEFKSDGITEDGHFKGYGSTFGGEPDSYGDIIVKGAFKETLAKGGRNGFGIAMLWQHNSDQPVGVWQHLSEDNNGLYVEGQLAVKTQLGKETRELMLLEAVKGLSIGYDIVGKDGYEYDQVNDIRYLKRIELWEISPVVFPANRNAQITAVKNIEDAQDERQLEMALRDAGLTRKAAKYVVGLCKPSLRDAENKESLSRLLQKGLSQIQI